jgi:hypothetical protein
MSGPRILTIMGSGEIAPTMAKVHRALFEQFGLRAAVPATLIDTPYGFQENADDLSERIVDYFRVSIGREMSVASYRSNAVDAVETATAMARIGEGRYVLAGPGSPSYALEHWLGGPIPAALAAKLAEGGVVTMASAAALTVGLVTIPVYEIYKVGSPPTWLDGLDLLGSATGLRAAVVPHYDNAEGGNHDTRFCYIGERRLRVLERAMPKDAFVLGVDSHTALVLDLERQTADVFGLGGVTVRADGRSRILPSGTATTIEALAETAANLVAGTDRDEDRRSERRPSQHDRRPGRDASAAAAQLVGSPREEVARIEGAFVHALAHGDMRPAVAALLELDTMIERRVGAGDESPDLHAARATFRSLIVRLGDVAETATSDPRDSIAPFVETLMELRARARQSSDWSTADVVRERLAAAGVEVRDDPAGSTWSIRDGAEQVRPQGSNKESSR